MRNRNKIFLWPIYFDISKTRREGRRVPKKFSVSAPKLDELQRAAKKLDLQPIVISDAAYPSCPWLKAGLLVIPKKEQKSVTLEKIARELVKLRG